MSAQSNTRARLDKLRQRRSTGTSRALFASPVAPASGGGCIVPPLRIGEELFYVIDEKQLCMGRVGAGDKVCLKSDGKCDIVAHSKNKHVGPNGGFLGVSGAQPDVGHMSAVLPTYDLDKSMIEEFLEATELDWGSEFAKIKANTSKNLTDVVKANNLIDTVKKHRTFENTPSKLNVEYSYETDVQMLSKITTDMEKKLLTEGENADVKVEFSFEEAEFQKRMTILASQMEAIFEFALAVENLFAGEMPRIQGHVQPIESVLNGLRLNVAALHEVVGTRLKTNTDIPPVVWSAIDASFESLAKLEIGLIQAGEAATEAKEIGHFLLENEESRLGDENVHNVNDSGNESDDNGNKKKPISFLDGLNKPHIKNGVLYQPTRRDVTLRNTVSNSGGGSNGGGSGSCCDEKGICSLCFQKISELETRLTSLEIRMSNLEEARSGNVEGAILIKHQVFRGRADVIAWLDEAFPINEDTKVEPACFATPHMIFNLVSADMCGLSYPKLDLKESDLAKMKIKRSDAISFYALLQDRPDFMISNTPCPMHTYKSSKADRDKGPIKFVPTYADFGMSSDPDTLHYKFKTSLHLIKDRQENYIESRLGHHSSRIVYEVSMQLLGDSIRFVSELLDFMEEVYSQCIQSFDAAQEAWSLVCHCIEEIFTKEFKPSLKYLVANDLVEPRIAYYGVVHAAFSLNSKVRELLGVGISNHNASSKSHVRFIMKMSRKKDVSTKSTDMEAKYKKLESAHNSLKGEHQELKKDMDSSKGKIKSLESTIQKLANEFKALKKGESGSKA